MLALAAMAILVFSTKHVDFECTLCNLAIIVFFASLGFRVAHYLLFEASWHSLYRGTFSLLGLRDQLYLSNKFGLSLSQFISILGA